MATILLVEDTADLARAIASELELSGYQVITTENGPDALTKPDFKTLKCGRVQQSRPSAGKCHGSSIWTCDFLQKSDV